MARARTPAHATCRAACRARARAASLALALALGPAALALAATPGVDEPPLPGPPVAIRLPHVAMRTLPNGLTVIVATRHATPLVTVGVLVRAGAERDPAGQAGLANLTAKMLARGARHGGRDLDSVGIAQAAESLGGDLQAGSGFQSGDLALTVTTPRTAEAVGLLADLVRHPTFPEDEFRRAVAEQADDLRVALSSPGTVAAMAARRAFWGDSPYGASQTPASLAHLTRAGVQAFHATWYRPDAAAVVFSGDIDLSRALRLARAAFGRWAAPKTPRPPAPAAAPDAKAVPLVSIDLGGVGQSGVAVAAPYVPVGSPDRYVAEVANAVLGGGYSARLNEEVRIKRGLAYGAGSLGESQPPGGMVMARAQTNNATAGEVVTLVRGEFGRMGTVAATPEELSAREATLVGAFGRRLETTDSLATLVAGQWIDGRPLGELDQYTQRVLAVTAEQVRAFAAANWTPASLRVAVAGDASKSADGMKPLLAAGPSLSAKVADVDFDSPTLQH